MPINTNQLLVDTASMVPVVLGKVAARAHQQAAPDASSWGSTSYSQESKSEVKLQPSAAG